MTAPRLLALAALGIVLGATPLAAQTKKPTASPKLRATSPSDPMYRLERGERQLASEAAATKGAPQQELLLEKRRVEMLIDALESGQRVDPREIDEAVGGGPSTPF